MDMIESVMVRHGISNGLISRLIYRSLYVCLIAFIAVRFLGMHVSVTLLKPKQTY